MGSLRARLRFCGAQLVELDDAPSLIFVGLDRHEALDVLRPEHRGPHELRDMLGLHTIYETYAPIRDPLVGWLGRFCQQVRLLQDHPDITVHDFVVGEPLTDAQMDDLAEASGATLREDLRMLYRQANGLALRWSFTSRGAAPAPAAAPMTAEWAAQDGGFSDGLVCIRPLAQLLGPRPSALSLIHI